MENIGGFLAATAFLAAILLVWAQLWVNTYRLYKERLNKDKEEIPETDYDKRKSDIESGISLGLAWIFLAIAFSVAALFCFAYINFVENVDWVQKVGMGFLFVALFMTASHVLQSFISAVYKFVKKKDFDSPSFLFCETLRKKGVRVVLVVVGAGIFLAFSLLGALVFHWW